MMCLRLLVVSWIFVLGIAGPTSGFADPEPQDRRTGGLGADTRDGLVKRNRVDFANRVLTREGAEKLAAREGMDLLGFSSCRTTTKPTDCLFLHVVSGDEYFGYFLSDRSCKAKTDRAKRQRRACFGGLTVLHRERFVSTTWAGADGFTFVYGSEAEIFVGQGDAAGRWVPVLKRNLHVTRTRDSASATTDSYDIFLFNQPGELIGESHYSGTMIASGTTSAADAVSVVERCSAFRDMQEKKAAAAANVSGLLCDAVLPEQLQFSGGGELVISLGGIVSWDPSDVCVAGSQGPKSISDYHASEAYLECINDPGKFFPDHYPASSPSNVQIEHPPIETYDQSLFPPPPSAFSTTCQDHTEHGVEVDMGNGTFCTGDVDYDCELESSVCTCVAVDARNFACTSGGEQATEN